MSGFLKLNFRPTRLNAGHFGFGIAGRAPLWVRAQDHGKHIVQWLIVTELAVNWLQLTGRGSDDWRLVLLSKSTQILNNRRLGG
jgi:hypothetical protein